MMLKDGKIGDVVAVTGSLPGFDRGCIEEVSSPADGWWLYGVKMFRTGIELTLTWLDVTIDAGCG